MDDVELERIRGAIRDLDKRLESPDARDRRQRLLRLLPDGERKVWERLGYSSIELAQSVNLVFRLGGEAAAILERFTTHAVAIWPWLPPSISGTVRDEYGEKCDMYDVPADRHLLLRW